MKLAVVFCSLLVAASVSAEDQFEAHFLRGQRLFIAEQYEEALTEFQAAYSVRQLPRCLIHIAKLHLKQGHARDAMTAYERYLKLVPAPPPEVLVKVQQGLDQAHALLDVPSEKMAVSTPRAVPPPPAERDTEKRPQSDVTSQTLSTPRCHGAVNAFTGGSAEDIWAVGSGICHFDGKQWTSSYQGWGLYLQRIFDGGSGRLWAVSDTNQVLHYDGKVWYRVNPGTGGKVVALWGRGSNDVWLMDQTGSVFHLDGTEWFEKSVERPPELKLERGYVQSERSVWAVGDRGQVVHWDGFRLTTHVTGSQAKLRGIWGISPQDVWVCGMDGTLLHYTNYRWHRLANNPKQYLLSLAGNGFNDIWAVGGVDHPGRDDTGLVLHWDGRKWTTVFDAFREVLRSVWARDAKHVMVGGDKGTVLSFDGKVWSELSAGPSKSLSHLWGKSFGDLWAVGGDGLIAHFDGQRWDTRHSRPSDELHGIVRLGPTDVWATGQMGTILHFDGTKWVLVPSGTHESFSTIAAISSRAIWALGSQLSFFDGVRWNHKRLSDDHHDSFDGRGIWVGSERDVWAFGHWSGVHFDGKAWSQQFCGFCGDGPASLDQGITGFWVRSATDVWVTGHNRLYRWNGQTTNVLTLPEGTPEFVQIDKTWAWGDKEFFLSADLGKGESRRTHLLHFDGISWSLVKQQPRFEHIHAVWTMDNGPVWIGTEHGVEKVDRARFKLIDRRAPVTPLQ